MFRPRSLLLVTTLLLAGCVGQNNQPYGAPDPTHPDMVFVDGDGCSWWVIGKDTSYSWAKHTNSKGEHVCSAATETPEPLMATETAEPPKPEQAAGPSLFIQVATFVFPANASASAERFKKLGLPVRPSSTTMNNEGYFRLVLGPFTTRAATQSALNKVVAQGFTDAFVYAR